MFQIIILCIIFGTVAPSIISDEIIRLLNNDPDQGCLTFLSYKHQDELSFIIPLLNPNYTYTIINSAETNIGCAVPKYNFIFLSKHDVKYFKKLVESQIYIILVYVDERADYFRASFLSAVSNYHLVVIQSFRGRVNKYKFVAENTILNMTHHNKMSDLFTIEYHEPANREFCAVFAEEPPHVFLIDGKLRGINGRMFEAFFNYYNFTYTLRQMRIVKHVEYAKRLALREIFSLKCHFNINYQSGDYEFKYEEMFKVIYTTQYQRTVLLAPELEKQITIFNIFHNFDIYALLLYFSFIILIGIAWFVYKKRNNEKPSVIEMGCDLFNVFIALGVEQPFSSAIEKLLVMMLLWSSFAIYSGYQTFMITNIITPEYQPPLKNIAELDKQTNLIMVCETDSICLFLGILNFRNLSIVTKENFHRIDENRINAFELNFTLARFCAERTNYTKYAFAVSDENADQFLDSVHNRRGRKTLFYKLAEPLSIYYYVLILNKRNYGQFRFEDYYTRVNEAGLFHYWTLKTKHDLFEPTSNLDDVELEDGEIVNLKDFYYFGLITLVIGWTTSILIFGVELVSYKIWMYKNKNKAKLGMSGKKRRLAIINSSALEKG